MSPPSKKDDDISSLRSRWLHLYATHLPSLALSRSPAQPRWPVHLDHCFARIILDNVIGVDRPWTKVVKAPAVRNMSVEQLGRALELGERVARGEVSLVELDGWSLRVRGKKAKGEKGEKGEEKGKVEGRKKRKAADEEDGSISKYFKPTPGPPARSKRVKKEDDNDEKESKESPNSLTPTKDKPHDQKNLTSLIASSTLTPFRKQTLTLLTLIPRGRWTTYQAMSDHITATSHKTCARAVGNAMRNNPFAPEVPCHRVLSSDGSIGGFGGEWGEAGKFAKEKRRLLAEEGVKFDSKGKVKGQAFRNFEG